MRPLLLVRHLTPTERRQAHAGLRSREAFTARRCQILLASSNGLRPAQSAGILGCSAETVRNTINAFHREGMVCLHEKSSRPHSAQAFLDEYFAELLKDLLHHSPRTCGEPTGLWTLDLLAEVCHTRGWTTRQLTCDAIRVALKRLGIRWQCAKVDRQPRPGVRAGEKKVRDRLISLAATHPDWVLGFADETWWSRLALPWMHTWNGEEPLRL